MKDLKFVPKSNNNALLKNQIDRVFNESLHKSLSIEYRDYDSRMFMIESLIRVCRESLLYRDHLTIKGGNIETAEVLDIVKMLLPLEEMEVLDAINQNKVKSQSA